MAAKEQYEAPALVALGTFEAITQAASVGGQLDNTFPVGTAASQLTFS